jgi:hypothetical protein
MLQAVRAVHQDDWNLISDMLMMDGCVEVHSVDITIEYRYNDTPIYVSIHVVRCRAMCVHHVDVAYSVLNVYPVYRDYRYMCRISWGMMLLYTLGQVWHTMRCIPVCASACAASVLDIC